MKKILAFFFLFLGITAFADTHDSNTYYASIAYNHKAREVVYFRSTLNMVVTDTLMPPDPNKFYNSDLLYIGQAEYAEYIRSFNISGDTLLPPNPNNFLNSDLLYIAQADYAQYIRSFSGSGVTKIIAGTNVTISPSSGLGNVTVNSTGGISGLIVNAIPYSINSTTLGNSNLFKHNNGVLLINSSVSKIRGLQSTQYGNNATSPRTTFIKLRGTQVSPTTIVSGDFLGSIGAYGFDGLDTTEGAEMDFQSTGTIGTNIIPGIINFRTSNSSGVLTLAGFFDASQKLNLTNSLQASFGGTGVNNGTNTMTWASSLNFGTSTKGYAYNHGNGIFTYDSIRGVSGTGSTNYIPMFTGTSTIGNSPIYANTSTTVGINTTGSSAILGLKTTAFSGEVDMLDLYKADNTIRGSLYLDGSQNASILLEASGGSQDFSIETGGFNNWINYGLTIGSVTPPNIPLEVYTKVSGIADIVHIRNASNNIIYYLYTNSDNGSSILMRNGALTSTINISASQFATYFNTGQPFGIGTSSPSQTLSVTGTMNFTDGNQAANKVLTSDVNGNATWQINGAAGVRANDLTAITIAKSIVDTLTVGSLGTYRVGGYLNTTAIATDVIQLQVTYTDENNTSQTEIFAFNGLISSISTVGNNPALDMCIRVKANTLITIKTVLTTGIGTITYDVGGNISSKLY